MGPNSLFIFKAGCASLRKNFFFSPEMFLSQLKDVHVFLCLKTADMRCKLTFESRWTASVQGCECGRQMWRAAKRGTKSARDWYRCHWERSEPCLKKTGPSILLPFKQTKGHLCTEPSFCSKMLQLSSTKTTPGINIKAPPSARVPAHFPF